MMVRPELPYSPGMEVMGVVDACGDGAGDWQGSRVVAMPKGAHGGFAEYADLPRRLRSSRCPRHPAARRGRAVLPVPSRLARTVRPRRPAGGREGADPRRGRRVGLGGGPARQACRRHGLRDRRHRREGGAVPRARRRRGDQLQRPTTSRRSCSATDDRGVDVVFDNVGEAVMEASMKCIAYNGRYLMMGFASNKEVADEPFIVPRQVMGANVRLSACCWPTCGARRSARSASRRWASTSCRASIGERITAEVVGARADGCGPSSAR